MTEKKKNRRKPFGKRKKAAGTKVTAVIGENLPHVYPLFDIPEGKKAIQRISAFIGGKS